MNAELRRTPPRRARVRWQLSRATGWLVDREWLIGVVFTIGLAALGTCFGLIPDIAVDGWSSSPRRMPWLVVFGTVGLLGIVAGTGLWRHRNNLQRKRGTAYIITEAQPGWTVEDKEGFLAAVRAKFAATRFVPGPSELGADWNWPLDQRADAWDQRVDELVRSFWANHVNDDAMTPNSLYTWAPWSVALAFAARAVAGRRGLTLDVRQRPTYGRAGTVIPPGFHQPGHTFASAAVNVPLTGTISTHEHKATLHVQPRPERQQHLAVPRLPKPITVLLLRTSSGDFGPLGVAVTAGRVALNVDDGAELHLPATTDLTVHEWRYTPANDDLIDWKEYPNLVANAADWITRSAGAHPDATVLLGTAIPQEAAVGLGIHATTTDRWPAELWPLAFHKKGAPLVIPRLNLGHSGHAAAAGRW